MTDLPWEEQLTAVPTLEWPDRTTRAEEISHPVEKARHAFETLLELSRVSGGVSKEEWNRALERLKEPNTRSLLWHSAGNKKALTPRILRSGKGTVDFKERLLMKDGHVSSSKVEVMGRRRDIEVAFFHSGLNRWRVSRVMLDTWYTGKVTR